MSLVTSNILNTIASNILSALRPKKVLFCLLLFSGRRYPVTLPVQKWKSLLHRPVMSEGCFFSICYSEELMQGVRFQTSRNFPYNPQEFSLKPLSPHSHTVVSYKHSVTVWLLPLLFPSSGPNKIQGHSGSWPGHPILLLQVKELGFDPHLGQWYLANSGLQPLHSLFFPPLLLIYFYII